MDDKRIENNISDQKKYVAYEILENKSFQNLKKIIDKEEIDKKVLKEIAKKRRVDKNKLVEKHFIVLDKVKQHKNQVKSERRDVEEKVTEMLTK